MTCPDANVGDAVDDKAASKSIPSGSARRALAYLGEALFAGLAALSVVWWAVLQDFGISFGDWRFAIGYLGYWIALLGALWLWAPTRFRTVALGLTLCAWAFLWLVPFSETTRFLADLRKVQPGMTVAEAEEIMAGYLRGTGWPAIPELDGSRPITDVGSGQTLNTYATEDGELGIQDALVFRFSNAPRHNSSWGIIQVGNGRVSHTDFWPD